MAKIKDNEPKPRNDAYTGLLAISFLALVGATVLMAMDASELGTPPPPFKVDGPGAKPGVGTNPVTRPDATKVDTTPNPEPKAPEPMPMPMPMPAPAPMMSSLKLPDIDVPAVVVPPVTRVSATEPAAPLPEPAKLPIAEEPPLIIKPFIPPM